LTGTFATPRTALAWDSVFLPLFDKNSHYDITRDALNEVLHDPNINQQWKDHLVQQKDTIFDYSTGDLGEAIHKQKKQLGSGLEYYYNQAVGSNPGSTHPEYWWQSVVAYYREWQSTDNYDNFIKAYQFLGQLVHAIEDQGSPPHAWYSMHGKDSTEGL
jgi:hypothetical protein